MGTTVSPIPALLTAMSSRPYVATVRATMASTSPASATSVRIWLALAARRADRPGVGSDIILAPRRQHHGRAAIGQNAGGRLTDPAARAGNDGDFSSKRIQCWAANGLCQDQRVDVLLERR